MKEDKTYFFNKVSNCNLKLSMLPNINPRCKHG